MNRTLPDWIREYLPKPPPHLFFALTMHFVDYRAPSHGQPAYNNLNDAQRLAEQNLRMLPHLRCVVITDFRGIPVRTVNRGYTT